MITTICIAAFALLARAIYGLVAKTPTKPVNAGECPQGEPLAEGEGV